MKSVARQPGDVVALAALGLAALWTLLAFATWGGLQNGVRVSSPFTTFGYGQAALFSSPVRIVQVSTALGWNALAMLIGYAFVIRPIWGPRQPTAAIWLFLAGAIPGMLMIGVVTRVVTLFLPNAASALTVVCIAVAAGALAVVRLWRTTSARIPSLTWRSVAAAGFALFVSMVFQVHIDRGHAVAEGSIWFITNAFLAAPHGIGGGGWFPLFPQHYDEAAFLHPLIHLGVAPGGDASGHLTLIYWLTLSVSRAAMVALTFIGLRGMRLDGQSAILCTAFVCAASLSLNPFSSRLLFDSLNPMIYTLHMSRFLAPVLPMLVVSAAMQGRAVLDGWTGSVALLLGLGFAAMPIHIVTVAVWAAALLAVVALSDRVSHRLWRDGAAVAAIVLAATSAVYFSQTAPAPLRAGVLVLVPLLCGLWLISVVLRDGVRPLRVGSDDAKRLFIVLAALAGFGLGLVLLGNVGIVKTYSLLGGFWPWSNVQVLQRLDSNLVNPQMTIAVSPVCPTGYDWGYRIVTGHCGSLSMFVRTYGLPFAAIAAVLGWRARRLSPSVSEAQRPDDALGFWSLVLCILALPVSFALFDFVTPVIQDATFGWTVWLRSRLVEPWFVGGTLIAAAYFLRHASDRARRVAQAAMAAAVAIHILNPLVAPAQWVANVAYWVSEMVR